MKDGHSPDIDGEEGSDSDSVVEFYEEVFTQIEGSLRASLHKVAPGSEERPKCNVAGTAVELVKAHETVSKATNFCQRCFGKVPPNGCSKLCTKVRVIQRDGVEVTVRCGRRCHLGCRPVARYLDVDEREQRCDAHAEVVESDNI